MSDTVLIPDPKAPGAEAVYPLDWTLELNGDTIAASAWTGPAGVVIAASTFSADGTTVTVSGGTDGSDYLLTDTVTTVGGLTLQGFVTVRVRQPGSDQGVAPVATRYATQADMVARFGTAQITELTDTGEVATGQIDAARLAQALADADATIDGYIGARYALPLANVPELLTVIACDIARYRLMGERPIETVQKRYDDASAWLDKIAQGKYSLGLDATDNLTPEGDDGPTVTQRGRPIGDTGDRVFDHHRLHDFLRPPRGGIYY